MIIANLNGKSAVICAYQLDGLAQLALNVQLFLLASIERSLAAWLLLLLVIIGLLGFVGSSER